MQTGKGKLFGAAKCDEFIALDDGEPDSDLTGNALYLNTSAKSVIVGTNCHFFL